MAARQDRLGAAAEGEGVDPGAVTRHEESDPGAVVSDRGLIRVLHLRDTDEIGGPGKTILETMSRIDPERFRLHLGVFESTPAGRETPFVKEAKQRGLSVHAIQGRNPFDLSMVSKLERLVRQLKIDIVHSHETLSNAYGYLAARRAGARTVSTMHGWIDNGIKDKLRIWMDKQLMRRFDLSIAVSEAMRRQVITEGIPPERVRVLHNCIVSSMYRPEGERGYLAKLLGRPLERPIVGCVGRLSPEKGQKDFLAAASIVLGLGTKASFVLAGDGPEREALATMARELGIAERVHVLGYQREMVALYRDLDLMVLPSHTEGLPNVVLESLLMRTPVVATDVGGTAEIVTHRETGILVEKRRPEAIARAISEFLESPGIFQQMAEAGRRRVLQEFNFTDRTRKLERIYTEVARLR
ncbi:MAG TPA: glycosyltransferase family 4 protein [Candidatus Methanoperedens sp.]|nr:glycosyltransferase family 4 protein [Candidatus Methanoperedens sp.]